ncbi:hypothetical protein [Halobaculum lipolyticum]|uniref:Uncharacterized protein n=1 Tax=Halobaculum lipolyticum TaxID=3032001 RepID=A0ABD5W6B8_9EURY|nr:hypothetical protein [Halobaculum sp. DT31]
MTLNPTDRSVDADIEDPIETHAELLLDAFVEHGDLDPDLVDAVDRLRRRGDRWDAVELVVVSEKDPNAARRLLDAAVVDG